MISYWRSYFQSVPLSLLHLYVQSGAHTSTHIRDFITASIFCMTVFRHIPMFSATRPLAGWMGSVNGHFQVFAETLQVRSLVGRLGDVYRVGKNVKKFSYRTKICIIFCIQHLTLNNYFCKSVFSEDLELWLRQITGFSVQCPVLFFAFEQWLCFWSGCTALVAHPFPTNTTSEPFQIYCAGNSL